MYLIIRFVTLLCWWLSCRYGPRVLYVYVSVYVFVCLGGSNRYFQGWVCSMHRLLCLGRTVFSKDPGRSSSLWHGWQFLWLRNLFCVTFLRCVVLQVRYCHFASWSMCVRLFFLFPFLWFLFRTCDPLQTEYIMILFGRYRLGPLINSSSF